MIREFINVIDKTMFLLRGFLFSVIIGRKRVGRCLRVGSGMRLRRRTSMEIGQNVTIWDNVTFWGPGIIVLGDHVSVGDNVVFYARERIEIGEDSMIASFSFITDANHGTDESTTVMRKQPFNVTPVRIERNVWIGAGCTVLKGAIIGENSVVGANSVVIGEIPANCIVVGTPARVVRIREES